MRQPSPVGLCTCVCWKSCLTWKPPPVPPSAPKVQPIALGGQIFSVLSDRIFNSIFFISEPSHVPTCLSYLYSNCLNIVSDGDVLIWICREEWCCGGMFNWLPAEQQWCVGFFLWKCYHFQVLLMSSGSLNTALHYSGVCFPPRLNTNEGHLLVFLEGSENLDNL